MSDFVEKNNGFVNTNKNSYAAAKARRKQEDRIKKIEYNAMKYEDLEKRINNLENLIQELIKESR